MKNADSIPKLKTNASEGSTVIQQACSAPVVPIEVLAGPPGVQLPAHGLGKLQSLSQVLGMLHPLGGPEATVTGFQSPTSPVLAIEAIWGIKHWMENYILLFL